MDQGILYPLLPKSLGERLIGNFIMHRSGSCHLGSHSLIDQPDITCFWTVYMMQWERHINTYEIFLVTNLNHNLTKCLDLTSVQEIEKPVK